jgi:hypothetical protein
MELTEIFKDNIVAVASREDGDTKKYSKRIYTDMIFKNSEQAKYFAKKICEEHNIDTKTMDTSIYNNNQLYPVVEQNVKNQRLIKWESGSTNDNPNNVENGVEIKVDIPIDIKIKNKKDIAKNKDYVNKYIQKKKDINNSLFLDLLNAIPPETWNYNEWRNLGIFCKTYFDLDLFIAISRQNSKYENDEVCEKLWNGIDCNINAGFIVNIAKRTLEEHIIKSIYLKNKFEGEYLTEKFIGKQGHYYFGDYFYLIKEKKKAVPYCFSERENRWREAGLKDFNNYVERFLDEGLKDHFRGEEGLDRKLYNRYNNLVSSKLKLTFEFFNMNCEEVNYTNFDNSTNLCFQNGYYDFNENQFYSILEKENLNLKTTQYPYKNVPPKKLEFLKEYFNKIFPNADDFAVFKYMIGRAVMGEHQKKMLFIKGRGNNGKSSFIPLILSAIGSYAGYIDEECLTEPIGTLKPRIDLFNLIKKRISVIQEPAVVKKINSSAMKKLTGGDIISFRSLYASETTDFVNNGLIIMSCNDMPDIDNPDTAVYNRLVVIEAKSMFVSPAKYEEIENKENIFIANPYFLTEEFREEYKETMFQLILEWIEEYRDVPFKLSENIIEENKRYLGDNDTDEYFNAHYTFTNNKKDYVKLTDLFRACSKEVKIGRNKFIKFYRNHPQYSRFFLERKKIGTTDCKNVLWGYRKNLMATDSDEED